jgi:hypothetical protein
MVAVLSEGITALNTITTEVFSTALGANLASALRHLRDKEAERFYFDDAVGGIYHKLSELRTWEVDDPVDDRGQSMKSFFGHGFGKTC